MTLQIPSCSAPSMLLGSSFQSSCEFAELPSIQEQQVAGAAHAPRLLKSTGSGVSELDATGSISNVRDTRALSLLSPASAPAMTLELHYWFSYETCGGAMDLGEEFVFTAPGNATACIPASAPPGRLPAQISVRWAATTCGSGGLLEMWQSRNCSGKVLSKDTVPAGQQSGKCVNFSPGKSGRSRCSMAPTPSPTPYPTAWPTAAPQVPAPVPISPPVHHGSAAVGAICTVLAITAASCGVWGYRKKKAGREISWSAFSADVSTLISSRGGKVEATVRETELRETVLVEDHAGPDYVALGDESDQLDGDGDGANGQPRGSRFPFVSK